MPLDPFALVGQTLDGQYRIDAVVGEGGSGVVYKGRHLSFEQPIAVKALKVPDVHDAQARISVLTKFREEAKLSYVLSRDSLSVVRCIGYGAVVTPTQAWAPYLVLEWLEGRPLSEELDERRRSGAPGRSLTEAHTLLAPVAAGLAHAHSQRVAHRDVKPANLFLIADDERGREASAGSTIKILDFGIAKVMEEGATAASAPLTKDGLVAFTPSYAAPEQFDRRLGPTGPWTDVYGFALVLLEVVAGRPPLQGRNMMSIAAQATNVAHRPTPRALGLTVHDAVEGVFARALAVDPKARFHDVGLFWEALTGALGLGGAPRHEVSAPPGWVPPAHTVPMTRVSDLVALPSPVATTGRTGPTGTVGMAERPAEALGSSSWQGRSVPGLSVDAVRLAAEAARASTPRVPERGGPRRRRVWLWAAGLGALALLAGGGVLALLEFGR